MKIPLAVGALVALAASSHAVLLDDFTTGIVNSGYISDPTNSYTSTTAASVPGGFRSLGYTKTTNPNGEDFRVRINPSPSMLMYTMGIEVDGIGQLGYGTTAALNANFTANPLFRLTVAANDLPNIATLTLTSSTSGSVTRVVNLPITTVPQIATFDFTGVNLSDIDSIGFSFDFSPSGDFAVTRLEAVPEPFSMAALATGVAVLGLRRRKRVS